MRFDFSGTSIRIEYGIFIVIATSFLVANYNILYVLLFSALHECGHVLSLLFFGKKPKSITISYYGIGMVNENDFPYHKELIFLISGIIINLIFALIDVKRDINFALFIINSLPIYPLDGGRVLKLLLNKKFSLNISDKVYYFISFFTLICIIVYSIYSKNLNLIIIVFYIIIYSINNTFD